MKLIVFFLCLVCFWTPQLHAAVPNISEAVVGAKPKVRFSLHRPTYFIFGDDDLKIQYSFKYRLAKSLPIYFAFSQLMFWDIYEESKPFEEVNYNPEVFYRLINKEAQALHTVDLGMDHMSNGKDDIETRSLDRIFVRANYLSTFKRNNLNFNLMVYYLYNQDETNKDIVNHLGFWELTALLSDVVVFDNGRLGIELRTFAGSKVYDLDQGGFQTGLIYEHKNENFNPSIYIQRFEGYSESLQKYNIKRTEYRIGLSLTF